MASIHAQDAFSSDEEVTVSAAAVALQDSDGSDTSDVAAHDVFSDSDVAIPASQVAAEFEDDLDSSEGVFGGRMLAAILGSQIQFEDHHLSSDSEDDDVTAAEALAAFSDSDDETVPMDDDPQVIVGPFTAEHFSSIPQHWIHGSDSDE
jgi:hypothetical protein